MRLRTVDTYLRRAIKVYACSILNKSQPLQKRNVTTPVRAV